MMAINIRARSICVGLTKAYVPHLFICDRASTCLAGRPFQIGILTNGSAEFLPTSLTNRFESFVRIPTSCVGWLFKSAEQALQQFFLAFDWAPRELDGRRIGVVSASCRGCGAGTCSVSAFIQALSRLGW